MSLPDPIIRILPDYIKGEATAAQKEELRLWIAADPSHEEILRGYISAFYASKWGENLDAVPATSDWNALLRKRTQRRRRRIGRIAAASVAACLLLAGGAWALRNATRSSMQGTAPAAWQHAEVTLLLSSGEEISLRGRPVQTIADEGAVIFSDSSRLVYRENDTGEVGDEIFNELVVPVGGEFHLILTDGTRVTINAGSRMRYPVGFRSEIREVWLEGEAYFEVQRDESKPFIVRTSGADIEVLGTSFNVADYPDEATTAVTLVEGSVRVCGDSTENILAPGQQYAADRTSGERTVREVDTHIYTAWTGGLFRFDAMPLGQLMQKLARWYGFAYEFRNEAAAAIRFTGGFRKYDDLSEILGMLEDIYEISFTLIQNKVIIDAK